MVPVVVLRDGHAERPCAADIPDGQHARAGSMRDERAACATDAPLAGQNPKFPPYGPKHGAKYPAL